MSKRSGNRRSEAGLVISLCLWLMAMVGGGFTRVVVAAGGVEQQVDDNKKGVAKLIASFEASDAVSALAFSTDGKSLALTTFKVPTTSGVEIWSWRAPARQVATLPSAQRPGSWTHPTALAYSPGGQFVALIHDVDITKPGQPGSWSSVVSVWNAQSGQLVKEIHDATAGTTVPALAFSSDGRWLLYLYERGNEGTGSQLVLYRTSDWQALWGVRAAGFHPQRLAVSPDGHTAAVGGLVAAPGVAMHAPIRIVDMDTRAAVREIDAFPAESNVGGLAWSPDGSRIAAGASVYNILPGVETIKVFDAHTGKELAGALAADPKITSLVYMRGGKYLAETGIGAEVTIWAGDLKKVIQTIPARGGPLAVSSDGSHLAVASGSTVSVWEFL